MSKGRGRESAQGERERGGGETMRDRFNARCYHQTCDEFDARWDMTGAAQEGSVAYALGREVAEGTVWPFAAERDATRAARK